MKSRIHKFNKSHVGAFCSFAIPFILLLQISLPGIALCFGTDGHVALENYSDGLCDEINFDAGNQNSANSSIHALGGSNYQHCGTCVDIPITDNRTEHKAVSSNDLTPEINFHVFTEYVVSILLSQDNESHRLIVQIIPAGITFLDSLQTTVITC